MTNRFQRGSGVYTCGNCGERTRETGEGESGVELCRKCYILGGIENAHTDCHRGKIHECGKCKADIEGEGYKVTDADTWCDSDGEPEPPYEEEDKESEWSEMHQEEANQQGWNIFAIDGNQENLQIQRVDELEIFESDKDAVDFVEAWAKLGNETCLLALKLINKKEFYVSYGIGKAKYLVNFHDGKATHEDGSKFYDVKIFTSKKKMNEFLNLLKSYDYKERAGL